MGKYLVSVCTVLAMVLLSGAAMAESIKGRAGVTGRVGFFVPADSDQVQTGVVVETDTGFIGGGGFIYGLSDNFAAELDITHAEFGSDIAGNNHGDFNVIDIGMGIQYRFHNLPMPKLVPYAGGGMDILVNDFNFAGRRQGDVETVVGGYLSGGIDYFILKQLALTAEAKGRLAFDADVKDSSGAKIDNFDPSGVSFTAGVRYFFN